MSRSTGRAKDRVDGRAVAGAVTDARAIVLRAEGASWTELAREFGYRSRSGAERAVVRGLDRSGLAAGLRVVMADRLDRLWSRVNPLEHFVVAGEEEAFLEALMQIHLLEMNLKSLTGGTRPPGVRDVAGLVAVRDPHLPQVDEDRREELLRLRQYEMTLDMIRLDSMRMNYANRSGVHKTLEREVRRLLLEVSAYYFENELNVLRAIWHEIECGLRRRPVEAKALLDEVGCLELVLGDLGAVASPLGVGGSCNRVSSGHGYPVDDTEFPSDDTPYPVGHAVASAQPMRSQRHS